MTYAGLAAAGVCAILGLLSHTNGEMNAWLVAALAWFSYAHGRLSRR